MSTTIGIGMELSSLKLDLIERGAFAPRSLWVSLPVLGSIRYVGLHLTNFRMYDRHTMKNWLRYNCIDHHCRACNIRYGQSLPDIARIDQTIVLYCLRLPC